VSGGSVGLDAKPWAAVRRAAMTIEHFYVAKSAGDVAKSTVDVAKSTVDVAKSTVDAKSTGNVAKSTSTA